MPPETIERLQNASVDFFHRSAKEKARHHGFAKKLGYTGVIREDPMQPISSNPLDVERESYQQIFPTNAPLASHINKPAPADFQRAMDDVVVHLGRVNVALHQILAKVIATAKDVDVPEDYFLGRAYSRKRAAGVFRCQYFHAARPEDQPHQGWFRSRGSPSQSSCPGSIRISYISSNIEEIRDGRWVQVPASSPELLHVSIGHIMHFWSNGLLQPNIRRVRGSSERSLSFDYAAVTSGEAATVSFEPICATGETSLFPEMNARRYVIQAYKDGPISAN